MIKAITILILIVTFTTSAFAQTGSIFGKVTDSETGEALPGASIKLKNTTNGSATDLNGEYQIRSVPVGERTLEIYYIGYESAEKTVMVTAGETTVANILLKSQVSTLGEVVVTGNLEGQQKALNQQRSADNIKNIVSIDLMSRFPDLNVAEALQRVPGINIIRNRGEGSTVSVRGTPAHFTAININGEQIPSTQDNGARNESLDLIPADQLASMEIVKAITPDMDGDAIGGSINLRTPTARSLDWRVKLEGGGGYNSLSQSYNGIGRVKLDRRFFEDERTGKGKLGVLLGFSYFETDNEEDEIEATWSGFGDVPITGPGLDTTVIEDLEVNDLINQRTRMGATVTLDYQFNPRNDIIFNFMYSRRRDVDQRNRLRVFMQESAGIEWQTLDTIRGTEIRRDLSLRDYYSSNFSYNLEGNHQFGKIKFDWRTYYADSKREEDALGGRFERGAANRVDLVATNPGGIYSDFIQLQTINSDVDFFDPFIINEVNRYERVDLLLNSDNLVAKFNFEIPYDLNNASGVIKTGFKYRRQSNNRSRRNDLYNYSDPNQVFEERQGFASVIGDFEDENFMNGNMRFGPSIEPEKFREFIDDNERLYRFDTIRTNRNTFNDTYDASEDILAAFVMSRLQWNKLMLLAGVRFEDNSVNYNAFRVNNITGDATPISDGTNYSFLLPNFHLKYNLNRMTNLRAAVTWSYARANFNDLVPFLQIDEEGTSIRAGNPELKPGSAVNIDLMAEHYLGTVGILSGGLFYKQIDDFQFTRNIQNLSSGPFFDEFPGFRFRQEQNGETASVYGLELNAQTSLNFLPGFLSGFGVYFNYTFTGSDATISGREDDNISLPGQAEHTWNGALSYDHKLFTLRAALNYNGTFLDEVAGRADNDIVQLERLQLDLNGSIIINSRIRLFAEFMNVTNAPTIQYQGIRERVSLYSFFGWWNRFGITYNIN